MGIKYTAETTHPVTFEELTRFVSAADAAGYSSIGTAAMIAYFWLQRQVDILTRLTWDHYRPPDNPNIVRIFHHKTRKLIEVPLYDEDGTSLWPELVERLDRTPRYGALIVTMGNTPDGRREPDKPWGGSYFARRVREIRKQAGWSRKVKFMGLRHGGNTEGAEAGLTDAQLRALGGHTSVALLRYAQETKEQRRAGARKRLEARTSKQKHTPKRKGVSE